MSTDRFRQHTALRSGLEKDGSPQILRSLLKRNRATTRPTGTRAVDTAPISLGIAGTISTFPCDQLDVERCRANELTRTAILRTRKLILDKRCDDADERCNGVTHSSDSARVIRDSHILYFGAAHFLADSFFFFFQNATFAFAATPSAVSPKIYISPNAKRDSFRVWTVARAISSARGRL